MGEDLVYRLDELGQEELLISSTGAQVMMEWEKDYMLACVDALQIDETCSVLEIGFGCGYSANRIQTYNPALHTIIECNSTVLERLHEWAVDKPSVHIVKGTWQDVLKTLSVYDCIFFDDYPLSSSVDNYKLDEIVSKDSRWHVFADACLNWHMCEGSRITGYMARLIDLHRPNCTFMHWPFRVEVPANCNYFPYKEAIVPLLILEKAQTLGISPAYAKSCQKINPDKRSTRMKALIANSMASYIVADQEDVRDRQQKDKDILLIASEAKDGVERNPPLSKFRKRPLVESPCSGDGKCHVHLDSSPSQLVNWKHGLMREKQETCKTENGTEEASSAFRCLSTEETTENRSKRIASLRARYASKNSEKL